MRIGVIADTHCPEFLDELPAAVFEKLRGVDLILHAGDVGDEETLDRRPNWFEWCWLQVIRHRRDRPVRSVGVLEIGDAVSATVLPLG